MSKIIKSPVYRTSLHFEIFFTRFYDTVGTALKVQDSQLRMRINTKPSGAKVKRRWKQNDIFVESVSYTHLTLPTIYSV